MKDVLFPRASSKNNSTLSSSSGKKINLNLCPRKRMFFTISLMNMFKIKKLIKERNGSMTVEIALVMPMFMFLLINIISLFEMISLHSAMESAIHQVGKEISAYAYVTEGYESTLLSEIYVKERIIQIIGRERLNDSVIVGGAGGIVLWRTKVQENNDIIDLVMTYKVSPRFNIFGLNGMVLVNRCYVKAYTGYERNDLDNEEPEYYVADTGEVYHISRSCTYLQLSIKVVDEVELEKARNEDGSRYKSCEICYDSSFEGKQLYITTQGERYHTSIACTGLKRTIHIVKESQLSGKTMCTRCMKEVR